MTDREEIVRLATAIGARCAYDRDGRLDHVIWGSTVWGGSSTCRSLIGFAEKARPYLQALKVRYQDLSYTRFATPAEARAALANTGHVPATDTPTKSPRVWAHGGTAMQPGRVLRHIVKEGGEWRIRYV